MPAALKALWLQLVDKLTSTMIGPQGYLAKLILNYGGQYLYDILAEWIRKAEQKSQQNTALAEQDKVQKDPNSKVEERAKAYEDVINSGR